jgi:hypothetical protein
MRNKKHTNGPWTVGEFFDSGAIDIRSENQEICLLRSEVRKNQIANARLIASAPELLDALETVLFGLTDDVTANDGRVDFSALVPLVREAIAKARGET